MLICIRHICWPCHQETASPHVENKGTLHFVERVINWNFLSPSFLPRDHSFLSSKDSGQLSKIPISLNPESQPRKRLVKAKLENREPELQPAYISIHPHATNTPPDLELEESPTTEECQSMRKSQSMKNTLGSLSNAAACLLSNTGKLSQLLAS